MKAALSNDIRNISMLMQQLNYGFSEGYKEEMIFDNFFGLVRVLGDIKKVLYVNISILEITNMCYCEAVENGYSCGKSEKLTEMIKNAVMNYDTSDLDYISANELGAKFSIEYPQDVPSPINPDDTMYFFIRKGKSVSGCLCVELEDGVQWTSDDLNYIKHVCNFFGMSASSAEQIADVYTSQLSLERVLNNIDALIYVSDIETNDILFVNDLMKRTFNIDSLSQGKCWQLLQEGITGRCEFCPVHVLKSVDDPPLIWEEHNTKTGRYYQNTDRLIKWVDNRVVHIQHSVDITEIKTAQEQLFKTQKTLETVFDAVPTAIYWKSADGVFEGVNKDYLSFTSFDTAEELIGQRYEDVRAGIFTQSSMEEDRRIISKEVTHIDYEKQIDDDKWIWLKKVPILGENDEVVSVLGVIDDISEHKRNEMLLIENQKKLEIAIKEANAASEAKSGFLSRMSHEIRTPMNAIIGMTKIAEGSDDVDVIKRCLDKITTASNHLLEIINDVLDMSKIEANKLTLVNEDFNFLQLMTNISDVLLVKADEKHINVSFIIDDNIPHMLSGDQLRLSQVVTNLMSNAIKFTPEFGKIIVQANLLEIDNDEVNIEFFVQDSGIGITEEQISRLFQAFEQADGSISRKYGGTGLGLVICKNIVNMMGGEINVYSDGESYSKFVFNIVAHTSEKEEISGHADIDFSIGRTLFIDDDPNTHDYFGYLASKLNLTADIAESGFKAIELMKENKYDVVFTDYMMPGMDGIATIAKLKEIDPNSVYVIISAAVEFADIFDKAEQINVKKFISKPLSESALYNVFRDARSMNKIKNPGIQDPEYDYDFSVKRLLLVEDIEINREIIQELLKSTNIIIDEAENGQIAVELFNKNHNYDIVFMDIHMPIMNGYAASMAIRELEVPGSLGVPIIAMTADVFAEDIKNCLEAKMTAHMAKPIDLDEVFGTLAKYLLGESDIE
jgi:PAS domain S-box